MMTTSQIAGAASSGTASVPHHHELSTTPAGVADDRALVLSLWQDGLTHDGKPAEKYDWYYQKNPAGAPTLLLLRKEGVAEPIGTVSAGARRMRCGTEQLSAGLMMDFIVARKHRGLFGAKFLTQELRRVALQSHAFILALPNRPSRAVLDKVGFFHHVGNMVRRARVLRSAEYLQRHLPPWLSRVIGAIVDRVRMLGLLVRRLGHPDVDTRWLDRADASFDGLSQRAAEAGVIMGVRDSEFLNWRFRACPLEQCTFFTLVSRDSQRLIAYAACEPQGATLQVHDFLADPHESSAQVLLWLELAREAYRQGHVNISVEFLGPESTEAALRSAGFVAREERPFLITADGKWSGFKTPRQWYVTPADEDG